MLLLLIVAFLSTPAFYVSAKRLSYHPGRAASLPFLAIGLLLIADYLISPLILASLDWLVSSLAITQIILYAYNVFLVLIYLTFISRNWAALTRIDK